MSSGLERILDLLDNALMMQRPQPSVMTSHRRSRSSAAAGCDAERSRVTDSPHQQAVVSGFYDDDTSLRPKSFLHDEVDEFNRVLAELLQPRSQAPTTLLPTPTAAAAAVVDDDDELLCCSSWSQNYVAVADVTLPDLRLRSNDHNDDDQLNCDFETETLQMMVTDTRTLDHSASPNPTFPSQPAARVTEDAHQHAVLPAAAAVDDDDGGEGDETDGQLEIVEEEEDDHCPVAKDHHNHSSRDVFADDLFNEDDVDSGYQSGNSTMVGPGQMSAELSARLQLQHRLDNYNANCRHTGLTMTIAGDSDVFQGFIRVHLNLHKPINIAVRPACPGDDVIDDVTTTESFYLPSDTCKVIHVTSEMTAPSVIQTLLNKFLITDSCQKFALYEKINYEHPKTPEERRLNGMLRRLADDEKPLQLCLRWSDDGGADSLSRRQFLLQDNVTSDIAWDSFSLPELEAFLRILDREEKSYSYQIQLKYGAKKKAAEMRLKQLATSA